MEDKRLDDAITIYLDRAYKDRGEKERRVLRIRKPSEQRIKAPIEKLPELKGVNHGYAVPVKLFPYLIAFHWTRRDWWRFKKAAYSQGRSGSDQLRELAERFISQHENSASED